MRKLTLSGLIILGLALISYIVFFWLGSIGINDMEWGVVLISMSIAVIGILVLLISGIIYLFKKSK